jgi:hypothetical protein
MSFDIGLDVNGDIPLIAQAITGIDLVIQRVQIRIRLQLGTYIQDQTQGIDWLAAVALRPFDVEGFGAQLRAIISDAPGVDRVSEFEGVQDGATIRYNARVAVTSDSEAEQDLIGMEVVVGNTHPAIITFFRPARLAPLPV